MSVRTLILIFSIFYSSIIHASFKFPSVELGKTTLKDIKKMYEIQYDYPFAKGTEYGFRTPDINGEIWCDTNGIVQGMFIISNNETTFEEIAATLSKSYEFLKRVPTNDTYFENNAKFRKGNYTIFVHAEKGDTFVKIYYMSKEYQKALIKEDIIMDIK